MSAAVAETPDHTLRAGPCLKRRAASRIDSRDARASHEAPTGSVGTVDTQFLDLPEPLPLDCGRTCIPCASPTRPTARSRRRATTSILVCHALSGDAHAAGYRERRAGREHARRLRAPRSATPDRGRGLGWWDGMIGPGKAFDTERFFVVSTNLLGGCRGTTGPSSTNPGDRPAVRRPTSR